jgi:hypothetical protein
VPGVDFGDVGVRTVGHEQRLGGRDDVVSRADHDPGQDGLPSGRPGGFGEGTEGYGSLGGGQDRDLAGWHAGGWVGLFAEASACGEQPATRPEL